MYSELRFEECTGSTIAGLVDRALAGEVLVIRGALQRFDLLRPLVEASLRGIRKSVGEDVARHVEAEGFDHIHEWVEAGNVPKMTDAVYASVKPLASSFLETFVKESFPEKRTLYYEKSPNIRFHIPYDLAHSHKKSYKSFSKDYGEGKITAHGPHRDSWLDCPSNGLNLWFAIGPVQKGNGLTVYAQDYKRELHYKHSGDIADGEKLHQPLTFDLESGDCVIFHTDQLHGSELNRTNETRYAISFRVTFDKPKFPNRHFHRYVNADMVGTPLEFLAHVPAMLQPSYLRSLVRRIREKLFGLSKDIPAAPPETIGVRRDDKYVVPLEAVPVGSVRGVTRSICVARLSESEAIALTRRCPHSGGDLANGWIDKGTVVCPWHSLPFDPATGRSPCNSLPSLRRLHCEIVGEDIMIDTEREIIPSASSQKRVPA